MVRVAVTFARERERLSRATACLVATACSGASGSPPARAPASPPSAPISTPAEARDATSLRFEAGDGGAYVFDTDVLSGVLRKGGRSVGLVPVNYGPTGADIAAGEGLFNHYRVFTRGTRYGYGARRWPSTSTLTQDGGVEVRWPATPERPFELHARYSWAAPNTLDLVTTVRAAEKLEAFEVFLASYYPEAFTDSRVWSRDPRDGTGPRFVSADRELGDWLAFPRDGASAKLISDGRWDLEPHPIAWTRMPNFDKPIAVRRDPESGLTIVSMARTEGCFGIFTPHGEEEHYSNYMSTFGQDVEAGETVSVRSRLVVLANPSEAETLEVAKAFLE